MQLIRDSKGRIVENRWSDEELNILCTMYPDRTNKEIGKMLGIHESTVYEKGKKLGLKKNDEIKTKGYKNLLIYGKKTRYNKGHLPANKGKKIAEYCSEEVIKKMQKTSFPKGHIPHNHKSVGYERINRDGYIEVKTKEPRTFKPKHRLVWEKENGAIPPGYNIQFRDGNRLNCNIENLYMISRNEQCVENSIHRYPEELQKSIRLLGKLKKTIKNTENEKTN